MTQSGLPAVILTQFLQNDIIRKMQPKFGARRQYGKCY